MENSIIFMIGLQVILILLNSVFACAEIAIISVNDTKLAKMAAEGDKRAVRLSKLTSQPSRFLATIQVAITLSGFLGSAFAAENFSDVLVNWIISLGAPEAARATLGTVAVVLITIILSYFTLVFGELVPKQIAMRKAEQLALGMSGMITGISKLFAPLVSLLTVSTNGILRLMGIDPNAVDDEVGEEEIRMMVDAGSEKGTIDNEERDFIQNVFEFDNLAIEDVITHRTEVVMLDTEDSDEAWEETISETGYTYYPICDGTPDQIIGILNTKRYFRIKNKTRDTIMQKAVSPAYFVPETLKADILLRNMRKERVYFAVVLDEYGGMSGVITLKDLLEELVGDLDDDIVVEDDEGTATQLEERVWKVDGSALLEYLSELWGINLPCEEYDTLNGLVFHTLGSLPDPNTEIDLDTMTVKVVDIQNYQIKTAIVTLKEEQPEEHTVSVEQ